MYVVNNSISKIKEENYSSCVLFRIFEVGVSVVC